MTTALHMIADKERRRRAQEKRPYAIALETFTYIDSSVGPVTINRGENVFDLGHEAIVAQPEKFDIGPGKRRGRGSRPELNAPTQTAATASGEALPRPAWVLGPGRGLLAAGDVELRASTSPIKVHINARARDDITRHSEAVPREFETGGVLIARRSFDSENVHLLDAWGPGPAAIRKRDSLVLDWAADHARAAEMSRATDRNTVVGGCWHVHPRGSARPSDPDLKMFAAAMADASARVWPLHRFVALIATSVGRSRGPDLTAWVVRRGFADRLVCERAVIA